MAKTPTSTDRSSGQGPGATWNGAGTHSREWQKQAQNMRRGFGAASKGEAQSASRAGKGSETPAAKQDLEGALRKNARGLSPKAASSRRPKFAPKGRNGPQLER